MLELNKEYTYKEICQNLGWKETTGDTKKKQIREIEESFEFFHPENKKTHKPKKSYIFTKQIREPVLADGRKNNGRTKLLSKEDFLYLFEHILRVGYRRDYYYSNNYDIYISNSVIYMSFGLDIYEALSNIKYGAGTLALQVMFEGICINAVKSNSITKICNLLGYKKNSLPKGIMYRDGKVIIPDDSLLEKYNSYMKEWLDEHNYSSEIIPIIKKEYNLMIDYVQVKFLEEGKPEVRRYNKITVPTDMLDEFEPDSEKVKELQERFRKIVMDSIIKSVLNRCDSAKKYKKPLTDTGKKLLMNYLRQLIKYLNMNDMYEVSVPFEEMEDVEEIIEKAGGNCDFFMEQEREVGMTIEEYIELFGMEGLEGLEELEGLEDLEDLLL